MRKSTRLQRLDQTSRPESSGPVYAATPIATVTLGALDALPAELLMFLISLLDTQSLARLLQLNSAFYALAIDTVYTHIRVFGACRPPPAIPLQGRNVHLAKLVRRVDVHAHGVSECAIPPTCPSYAAFVKEFGFLGPLPHMHTLRIYIDAPDIRRRGENARVHIGHEELPCSILANLRPRKLILRGPTLFASWPRLLADPEFRMHGELIERVEQLVVVLEEDSKHGHVMINTALLLEVGQCMTQATFVFLPLRRGKRILQSWSPKRFVFNLVRGLIDHVLQSDPDHRLRLTFVNVSVVGRRPASGGATNAEDDDDESGEEANNPDGGDGDDDDEPSLNATRQRTFERLIRGQVESSNAQRGSLAYDVTRRHEMIRFITMDEYLAEPGILDVLDADELSEWL
ncbi:uncharacterized protein LOC62_05G007298 [Vanrija pseudolonga]|uniref:F-box domain-containing protein n=1 Tax=Vanrija pseudolonga TaxID=143232 RepID=A0AAF1BMU4_9TREE|nr:hypothetical protein LOC62_05G007298 [Vanrija pseudolonga]